MDTERKIYNLKMLACSMLEESNRAMVKQVDKLLKSGAIDIDIDSWDEKVNPMILPKCMVTAILQNESHQYEGKGTSFEKQIKKEVNNMKYFL